MPRERLLRHENMLVNNISTMDSECVELLPRVWKVLADLGKSPLDDTSFEKLLDWLLLKIEGSGTSLLDTCPCLPEFISSVTHNLASDPSVVSFTLKLTGLLAANEDSFRLLQERSLLGLVFDSQRWQEAGFWDDPCIRIGWIQGLRNMLQQPLALHFLVETGVTKPLLQLQTDTSLFVASAANQMLAHILVFSQPDPSESCKCIESTETNGTNAHHSIMGIHDENAPPTLGSSHDYSIVATAVMNHLKESLVLKENTHPHQCLQSLKLVALLLAQAGLPLRDTVLTTVLGPLETLVSAGNSQQTPLLLDVLLIAYSRLGRSEGVPDKAISGLISRMLDACKPPEVIHAAAAVLQRDHRGLDHTAKAVGILLLPFDIITGVTLLDTHAAAQGQRSTVAELLNRKTMCVSMLCVCLTHAPQIALMPADFLPCPPVQIVTTVLSLLQLCGGHAPSLSTKACRNVIGCAKVQKCLLHALAALSAIPGAKEKFSEVSTTLIQYLHNPESDPTVLQKSYLALLKWMADYNNFPSMADMLTRELLPVVRKRACDLHWEVRDSTVEFVGQLAVVCAGVSEVQLDCSTTPLLMAALCDPESYVRASAVTALAQTLTHSWQQGAVPTQEETDIVSKLLEILSQDTEGFARRAAVRYFLCWYSAWGSSSGPPCPPSAPPSLLTDSVRAVLSQGSADLDWEVKVHTLELAELLLDKTLRRRDAGAPPYTAHPYAALGSSVKEDVVGGCAHGAGPDGAGLEGAGPGLAGELSALVQQGVLSALLSGLFDCDRPVALKACRLLSALRETVAAASTPGAVAEVSCQLDGRGWGPEVRLLLGEKCHRHDEVPDRLKEGQGDVGGTDRGGWEGRRGNPGAGDGVCVSVCEVLGGLGLDERLAVLTQSSDHVQNSPLSLLQDILTAGDRRHHSDTHPAEDVIVDCY